ncbi:nitroreductase family protein [Calidithermus chliarophilus]|uniref:nitroreductase family protein n=1 Tax=Calidithermus chliarophilus TaxID=52023 RepID=UPI0003F636E0|nr:nitroreductase family protein [Calidithermus chliarophilus]
MVSAPALHFRTTYLKQTADRNETHDEAKLFPPLPPHAAEHPLPHRLVADLGTLGDALEPRSRPDHPASTPSLVEVATIAHLSLGFSRYEPADRYPYHRPAPAPRCKGTTELYFFTRGGDLPPGLYRYDPRRHSLASTPCAAFAPLVWELLERRPGLGGGWLLTTLPQRLRSIYGDFAARLCLLAAGHAAAQVCTVSGALGRPLRCTFEGLPEFTWPPLEEMPVCWLLEDSPPVRVVPGGTLGHDLREVIYARHSAGGPNGVWPVPQPQSRESVAVFEQVIRAIPGRGWAVHALILRAEGFDPGVYRWDAVSQGLRLQAELPASSEWHRALFMPPGFQARNCSTVWFVSGDTAPIHRHGMGAFRAVHTTAGAVAQYLSLAAAASGLFARPSLSFDEAYIDRLLGLERTSHAALYQVLVGKDRPCTLAVPLML